MNTQKCREGARQEGERDGEEKVFAKVLNGIMLKWRRQKTRNTETHKTSHLGQVHLGDGGGECLFSHLKMKSRETC